MPAAEKLVTLDVLTSKIEELGGVPAATGMVSEELAVTHGPLGGVPLTVPVLAMEPLVTSVEVVV